MNWVETHAAIRESFGWSAEADQQSAQALAQVLPSSGRWNQIGTELKHRPVATVVGCAESLDRLNPGLLEGSLVAADGATGRLQELNMVPRVVVTDLDGDPDGLRWAAENGASFVVHAHGDNQDKLDLVRELGPFVVGTHQGPEEVPGVRRAAGFTDGDRAALLCGTYGVKRIRLVAFDAGATSRFSQVRDATVKARKLEWMEKILTDLATTSYVERVSS